MFKSHSIILASLALVGLSLCSWATKKEDEINPLAFRDTLQAIMDDQQPPQINPVPASAAAANRSPILKTAGFYGTDEEPCGLHVEAAPNNRDVILEMVQSPFRTQDDCPSQSVGQKLSVVCPPENASICRVSDKSYLSTLTDTAFILYSSSVSESGEPFLLGIVYHYAAQRQLEYEDILPGPAIDVGYSLPSFMAQLKQRALSSCKERGFQTCEIVKDDVDESGPIRIWVTVEGNVASQ